MIGNSRGHSRKERFDRAEECERMVDRREISAGSELHSIDADVLWNVNRLSSIAIVYREVDNQLSGVRSKDGPYSLGALSAEKPCPYCARIMKVESIQA